jgi:hypothetical protein
LRLIAIRLPGGSLTNRNSITPPDSTPDDDNSTAESTARASRADGFLLVVASVLLAGALLTSDEKTKIGSAISPVFLAVWLLMLGRWIRYRRPALGRAIEILTVVLAGILMVFSLSVRR